MGIIKGNLLIRTCRSPDIVHRLIMMYATADTDIKQNKPRSIQNLSCAFVPICTGFGKYKDDQDQRTTVVHFILVKWRFLPAWFVGWRKATPHVNAHIFVAVYIYIYINTPAVEHFTLPSSCLILFSSICFRL